MTVEIRLATSADATEVGALVAAYVAESFPDHPGTPATRLATLLAEPAATRQRILVAWRAAESLGFVAWDQVFDLHWGHAGAQVADLYVRPAHRGRGVALALVAAVCEASLREGARFLRGGAYERDSATGRFYERIAVAHDSAECHCGGRAFRALAALAGLPPREIAREMPPRAWNFEP